MFVLRSAFFSSLTATILASAAHSRHYYPDRSASALSTDPTCNPPKPHPTGYFNTTSNSLNRSGIPLATLPDRNYTLLIPPSYDGSKALPLIISFHGHGKTAESQYRKSQWGNSSINSDYIVAYPNGLPGTNGELAWQGPNYAAPGVDDIGFTSKLVDYLTDSLCVDAARIYANGKSNGGGFVDTLACSDVGLWFAAFSAASGAFYTDTSYDGANSCNATMNGIPDGFRAPFLETHGSDDTVISYDGNQSGGKSHGETPIIPEWLGWWARRNGCDRDDKGSSVLSHDGKQNTTTWDCADSQGVVQGYWLKGLGHDWPSETGPHKTVLEASTLILEFYRNWTLPATG